LEKGWDCFEYLGTFFVLVVPANVRARKMRNGVAIVLINYIGLGRA
jgi:hypothetical protein